MRFIFSVILFLSFCTFVMGQRVSKAYSIETVDKIDDWNTDWKTKDYKLATPKSYSETASKGVIIQNSFPKGGGLTDSSGYRIFWNRVVNETATPLELTINFPADSFAILSSPDSYLKFFLPPGTMTPGEEALYSYGVTGLESFLDTAFNKPTILQRTINPKEEYLFRVGVLMTRKRGTASARLYQGSEVPVRAGFELKEQDLFYTINIVPQLDSALIPWGHVSFKK